MIFKITYDSTENPVEAELWQELNIIPPSELDAHPTGLKFDKTAWVDAENREDALEKAKQIDK